MLLYSCNWGGKSLSQLENNSINKNLMNWYVSNFNLGFIGKFQMAPLPVNESNWLQCSVWLGGKQSGSNYNAWFEYIYARWESGNDQPIGTGVGHTLAPQTYSAATDRKLYDRWYSYNQSGYCVPGVFVNPDLGIVAGTAPTLYGEVESGHHSDEQIFLRLDQCSSQILCYTDKCFSLYAKASVTHLRYYQRNDATGTVYVLSRHFNHLPSDQM